MPTNQQSAGMAWGNASQVIGKTVTATLNGIQKEVTQRTYRASNELRGASLRILRGKRSGKKYRVPNTSRTYTASAPGEPPAVLFVQAAVGERPGAFRLSWGAHVHVEKNGTLFRAVAAIESRERAGDQLLGETLENGTGRMKPRPYKQKVIDMAMPKVKALYQKPYKGG